ncbi:MAG: oxidoreductase [Porticoccaceae bacterium]|nr:MAG: oxidoreductase [Porticoccaceae bacterium]
MPTEGTDFGIPIDLAGRIGLVTGAASGLGRATALCLARAGADLALVDLDGEGLAATAREMEGMGRTARPLVFDIADPRQCEAAVAETVAAFGALDALCNVAGIMAFHHSHEMCVEDWQRILDVNLSGPFHLIRAAIPHLLARDGAVVNVASSAAFVGEAYAAAYCASKAGLVQLTRALAMEYVHAPIRINAVAPGGMVTNIARSLRIPEGADRELIRRYSGLRGQVEVEEVARLIALLCSDAGRGFHGACLNIDKGITAG